MNVKVDEFSNKPDDTNKSDPTDDEQKLVIIEVEVQKDVEQNSADEDAQPVEDEEDEAQEEVIPRCVRLNHFED